MRRRVMTCPSEDTLLLFLGGQLPAPDAAAVERHVDECAACSELLAAVGRGLSLDGQPSAPPADPGEPTNGGATRALHARATSVDRYILLGPLGAGGMGVVYAAYDAELDRRIALKLLRPDREGTARVAETQARLLREAQALARLQHPNVVAVYDAGTFGDEVFVAMELVDGVTLARWLRDERRSWRDIVGVFAQAGAGLAAAHAAGLVHRDFKPDNVLVGKDGRARVVDFGLARPPLPLADAAAAEPAPQPEPPEAALTRTGAVMGTPAYMSPEQRRGAAADARTDQFSFCVALHEALHGARPGGAERPLPSHERRIPAHVRRALRRGLSDSPGARYPSMAALLADLTRSPWRKRVLTVAAVAAAAAFVAGGLGYRAHVVRERRQCEGAAGQLAGVWDEPRRQRAQAAFVATGAPHAAEQWRRVAVGLDRHAASWVASWTDSCEATRDGRQPAHVGVMRAACFDWRREEMRVLGSLLERPDAAMVERASLVTRRLGAISECNSTKVLSRRPRPPRDPVLRARVDAVRTQLMEALLLYYAGKPREALAATRLAEANARATGDRATEAEALHALGQMLIYAEDRVASETVTWQAVAAAEASGHDEVKAEALVSLAWLLGTGAGRNPLRLAEAERYGSLAGAAISRLGGEMPRLEAALVHNLGVIAGARGRYAEAQRLMERALQIRGREADEFGALPTQYMLAVFLMRQGHLAAAASLHEDVVARRGQQYGRDHPLVVLSQGALAETRALQGRCADALLVAHRTLDLGRRGVAASPATRGEAHAISSRCLAAAGRLDAALGEARRAVTIMEEGLGPRDPRLAECLDDLGAVLRQSGQLAAALVQHRRALAVLDASVEPDHPDAARSLHGIGLTLLAQGQPAAAVAPLERALAIRARAAIAPADVAATRFALAQALAGAGRDPARAGALARQSRDGYAEAEGPHEQARAAVDRWLARAPAAGRRPASGSYSRP
jgi:tetratricopeptide (TPR) repeat protein